MRLSQLTFLVLSINSAIDSGKYDHITIHQVHNEIERRNVVPWLQNIMGKDIDLSLFDEQTSNEFHDGLFDVFGGNKGREDRKWGVKNRGLCLLLAWTVELLQWRRFELLK